MAEKQPHADYRTPVVRKSEFTLLGKTYVALYAVVAFEPYSGNITRIYLDSGHQILVDLPAHNVRNIMESK